jgi:4-hydroxybenzoate polyprenyltransferase
MALGLGLYIAGVTTFARDEAGRPERGVLSIATLVMICGLAMVAVAPRVDLDRSQWMLESRRGFPLLIAAIGGLLLVRLWPAVVSLDPSAVRRGVRHALLSLIPISAAIAALAAGPWAGASVFALVVPATLVARLWRTT